MRVAVLTLTRDRLQFTRHCFDRLYENAGCSFDHYVLDQGSTDGTREWLEHEPHLEVCALNENIGISCGMNLLLDEMVNPDDYDCIVKFDNDCELVQPDTLRRVCELCLEGGALLSPRILGLRNPPQHTRELQIGGEIVLDVPQIGGIFLACPADWYDGFRYDEGNPAWGLDDVQICAEWRAAGGTCGYVRDLEAWHYLGTDGQRADQPEYFVRKDREYAA